MSDASGATLRSEEAQRDDRGLEDPSEFAEELSSEIEVRWRIIRMNRAKNSVDHLPVASTLIWAREVDLDVTNLAT